MKVAVLTPRAGVWNHRWLTADGRDDFAKEKNLIRVINLLKNTPEARRPGILITRNIQQLSGRPGEECVFLFDEQFQKRSKKVKEKLHEALESFDVEKEILPMFENMKNVPSLILAHESIKELEQKLRQIAEQEPQCEPATSASPLGNMFKLIVFILLFLVLGLLLVRNLDLAGEEKRVVPSSTFVIQLPGEEESLPKHEESSGETPKAAPEEEHPGEPEEKPEPEPEPVKPPKLLTFECSGTVKLAVTRRLPKRKVTVTIAVDGNSDQSREIEYSSEDQRIESFNISVKEDRKSIKIEVSLLIEYYRSPWPPSEYLQSQTWKLDPSDNLSFIFKDGSKCTLRFSRSLNQKENENGNQTK